MSASAALLPNRSGPGETITHASYATATPVALPALGDHIGEANILSFPLN